MTAGVWPFRCECLGCMPLAKHAEAAKLGAEEVVVEGQTWTLVMALNSHIL